MKISKVISNERSSTPDIQTGRNVYVNQAKYASDPKYKERVNSYVKEGFKLVFGTPDEPSSSDSEEEGTEPTEVVIRGGVDGNGFDPTVSDLKSVEEVYNWCETHNNPEEETGVLLNTYGITYYAPGSSSPVTYGYRRADRPGNEWMFYDSGQDYYCAFGINGNARWGYED